MKSRAFALLAALGAIAFCAVAAFGQDAVTSTAPTTIVTVPVGNWVSEVLPLLSSVLVVLVMAGLGILLRFLPPWLQAIVTPAVLAQVQALAQDAINWGVQATAGAVAGKEIPINVGNQVVASAAQHAIDTWPKAVIDKLGGLDGVKKAIIKQLEAAGVILPTDSTAAQVLSSAPVRTVTGPR